MSFPIVPLAELCDMDRQGLNPNDPIASHLPFVGVEHVESVSGIFNFNNGSRVGNQRSTSFRFDERHVLYAKLRPYLNKVATPEFAGRCSTELVPLLPRHGIDRDFIAYLLRRKETVEYVMMSVTGTRMPRADMKVLMSLPVLLPPLDEQQRIIGILNRAMKIERLRVQAQERLREFIAALFIKMFGDPVENPMGWNSCALGDLADIVAGQSPPGNTYNEEGEGLPFFQGKADFGEFHPVARKWCVAPRKIAEAGDILISVRAPIGPTNIAGERCCIGRGLAAIRPDETAALRDFVLWNIKHLQPELVAKGQGSTFTAIGQRDLKSLLIPLPPLEAQRQFVAIIKTVGTTVTLGKESSTNAAALLSSLMSRLLENEA